MREIVPVDQLLVRPIDIFENCWFLLCAGNRERFNAMTISWGSLGVVWHRPFVQVFVRHVRHTYAFMEEHGEFTLSAFAEDHREDLKLLGSLSGRDGDKLARTGLTASDSVRVACPSFAEAVLSLECRVIYKQDLQSSSLLEPTIEDEYPNKDYHRVYFGEILAVTANPEFHAH